MPQKCERVTDNPQTVASVLTGSIWTSWRGQSIVLSFYSSQSYCWRVRWEPLAQVTTSLVMSVFFLSSLKETISEQLFYMSMEWSKVHLTKRIIHELRNIGDLEVKIRRVQIPDLIGGDR